VLARFQAPARPLGAIALGTAVGVLTSLLQAVLDLPWLALVNASSPWLTTAFVAGALQRRMRTAVWVGAVATGMQVVGYYVTADLRGFGVSAAYVALWSACAVVGGPLFGAAGQMWRRGAVPGLGVAAIVAAYAGEAVVAYQLRLGYTSTAVLFLVVAAVLAVALGSHRRQHGGLLRWLPPALALGAAGHLLLGWVVG
jgi:hypothetical protein